MLNIIRINLVGILWQICDGFSFETFTVASLYYYVLSVIFVALN
jgi:hypothetical protein